MRRIRNGIDIRATALDSPFLSVRYPAFVYLGSLVSHFLQSPTHALNPEHTLLKKKKVRSRIPTLSIL
jgi:hypothetical protein